MAVNHHSGRVVVELQPELKLALHAALGLGASRCHAVCKA